MELLSKKENEIFIENFNNIYYFEFSKDFFHEPESHNYWEMVYVDNGNVNAIANDVVYSLSQGQAIFHQPMETHSHISDKRVANNMLVVSFSAYGNAMEYFKGKTFTLDKNSKTILKLFLQEAKNALGDIPNDYQNHLPLDFSKAQFGSVQLLNCHFTEFLIKLIRSGNSLVKLPEKQSRNDVKNSMCEIICEYMKRNIYSNLSIKELCSSFSIGKTQLCKIFKESLSQSPMDYFTALKNEEAKKLLREKNYSISQISDMLGYSSIHNFSRAFKKAVGMSPTAYTKSIL